MELSERLKACLKIEIHCVEIYQKLGRLLPEAKDLFETLASSEERHADILTISVGFNDIHEIPNSIVPHSLEKISETVRFAEEINSSIDNNRLSLEQSLTRMLQMENSLAESYLHEVMTQATDSDVISYLQQFYEDEKSHADMIREFMLSKGFSEA
jgi:rubrerythrin